MTVYPPAETVSQGALPDSKPPFVICSIQAEASRGCWARLIGGVNASERTNKTIGAIRVPIITPPMCRQASGASPMRHRKLG